MPMATNTWIIQHLCISSFNADQYLNMPSCVPEMIWSCSNFRNLLKLHFIHAIKLKITTTESSYSGYVIYAHELPSWWLLRSWIHAISNNLKLIVITVSYKKKFHLTALNNVHGRWATRRCLYQKLSCMCAFHIHSVYVTRFPCISNMAIYLAPIKNNTQVIIEVGLPHNADRLPQLDVMGICRTPMKKSWQHVIIDGYLRKALC